MIRRLAVTVLMVSAIAMVAYQLSPVAESPLDPPAGEGYLDLHVHAAGIGAGDSGCFLSEEMREGFRFDFYPREFDVTLAELEREGDAVLLRKLSEKIIRSRQVEKAVVPALDGVVNSAGQLDKERTQVYVPNEFLARELAGYDNPPVWCERQSVSRRRPGTARVGKGPRCSSTQMDTEHHGH